ncbi:predicted protein [Naegleria gruberi]|uniref:Predicted protein n=1 Tax=Naegleria gruberi TaxID=5762 RepID=D2VXW7_NAEGR|nr:uncharacterized protein NAEGRDRAFT_73903 [Naegleria gruberi]EFC38412.1 predicted protein [Naegleria gruberi]|eukprot:XP_002671156.1 predicted protein [Naegleria gruberi strain NEG-M]
MESFQKEFVGKRKLMRAYFHIKFYEKHTNLLPREYLNDELYLPSDDDKKEGFIPRLISASNEGYVYAEGFCSQLCGGYFVEGYDPSCPDVYRTRLNGQYFSIFSAVFSEDFTAMIEQYLKTNHAMIFTVVVYSAEQDFDSLVNNGFGGFEKLFKLSRITMDRYIISFGIHYGGKDQNYSKSSRHILQNVYVNIF